MSTDTGSISQSKSSRIVRSGTYAKHEDRVRADRTAPVCMRSYSSADNTCGGAEREEKNENDRIFKNGI